MRFGPGKYLCMALLIGLFAIGLGCAKAPDDTQLSKQISSKLNQDSGLQGKSITVQTKGGVVTLSGTVDNDMQRAAASNYASTTPGIKVVVNNLQIAAPAVPDCKPDGGGYSSRVRATRSEAPTRCATTSHEVKILRPRCAQCRLLRARTLPTSTITRILKRRRAKLPRTKPQRPRLRQMTATMPQSLRKRRQPRRLRQLQGC